MYSYVSILQNNSTTDSLDVLSGIRCCVELNCSCMCETVDPWRKKLQSARDIIIVTFYVHSYDLTASMLIVYALTYKDPGLTQ